MIYQYTWHAFAYGILESSKAIFQDGTLQEKQSRQRVLYEILKRNLKLLHPFMPFITEELWTLLPKESTDKELLMIERWPS